MEGFLVFSEDSWGVASIRHSALLVKSGVSNTNFYPSRRRLLDRRPLFESGRLLEHLRYFSNVNGFV